MPDFRILVIDDNPAIHADFRRILEATGQPDAEMAAAESALFGAPGPIAAGFSCAVDTASQGEEGARLAADAVAAGQPYAVAFVDMRMPPGWDGIETTTRLWQIDPSLQVVLCTAYSDHPWESIRSQLGTGDSLLILRKPFDPVEVRQLAASLTEKWRLQRRFRQRLDEMEQIVERRTAELRHSEERFAIAFRAAPLPQAILNLSTGLLVDANDAFCTMLGVSHHDLRAHAAALLRHSRLIDPLRGQHPLRACDTLLLTTQGESRRVLLSTQPTQLGGEPHLIIMAEDTTDRHLMEQQLRQSQKMEAVGQLAAGVAHDFNNILTVIQGHLSLMLTTGDIAGAPRAALTEVLSASERAATLTRQLLTFSRRQLFQPAPLDLNDLIRSRSAMLQRLIGEHIEVSWECQDDIPVIMGDAPALEQVIANLVINARDAMPGGGRLRIATGLVSLSPARAAQNPDARPGSFVRFSVTDTGHGMDEATLARIFEPFFTTREAGKGSGMGLAAVYGIVRQHEGWIEVFSDPGKGASFFIYLPLCPDPPATVREPAPSTSALHGFTVLLVEDEPAVRTVMHQLLRHCGCHVLEAGDAREGYARWQEHRDAIDLLVTDIVMPGGATGHDLARRLLEEKPDLKVIYSSGYSADLFQQGSDLVPGRNFLPKPYDAASVLTLIRRLAAEPRDHLPA